MSTFLRTSKLNKLWGSNQKVSLINDHNVFWNIDNDAKTILWHLQQMQGLVFSYIEELHLGP